MALDPNWTKWPFNVPLCLSSLLLGEQQNHQGWLSDSVVWQDKKAVPEPSRVPGQNQVLHSQCRTATLPAYRGGSETHAKKVMEGTDVTFYIYKILVVFIMQSTVPPGPIVMWDQGSSTLCIKFFFFLRKAKAKEAILREKRAHTLKKQHRQKPSSLE